MRTEKIDNTNFQGKLIIQNKLSRLADFNLNKVKTVIEKNIARKKYDLYVSQDYTYQKLSFIASHANSSDNTVSTDKVSIPIISRPSRYIEAAGKATDIYEKALNDKEQKEWENKKKLYKMNIWKDAAEMILLFPFFIVSEVINSINPKWANKFDKLIDKL